MTKCTNFAILLVVSILRSPSQACASCNVTSCGPPPPVAACPPGVSVSLPRVECAFNNVTNSCQWKILPCPIPVCDATNCGPKPNAPNFLCPDGTTVAGPSACTFDSATGTCGYPFITCPSPTTCNETSCGAQSTLKMLCPDGSARTGVCVFNNKTQKCGYEYPNCKGDNPTTNLTEPVCNTTSCGPRPLYQMRCADGTSVGAGPCVYNSAKQACGYVYPKCQVPVCNVTTCGPQPKIANRLCPDGTTLAGPGACSFNNATKKCGYPITTCPTCKKNSDCKGENVYCSTDGFCHADATCASNLDCINPNNGYVLAQFIPLGQVICTSCNKGFCGRTFTPCGNVCPSKTNFTNCNACSYVKNCLRCQATCF